MVKNSHSSGLSARQEAFAVAYARHHNASQAAREAKYAHGCASVTGTRLIANASVSERIRELEAQTAVDMGMSRERLLAELVAAADLAKLLQLPMGIVAAYREIAKICGFYQPERVRVEVDLGGQNVMNRIKRMTDEELLALMAQGAAAS
jgi:phage terminase small subunit